MRKIKGSNLLLAPGLVVLMFTAVVQAKEKIVHDAEYYILEAQNGKLWAVEDGKLDRKLTELRNRYGARYCQLKGQSFKLIA